MSEIANEFTDERLEARADLNERRAKRCGWLVIAGLVLETGLTAIFPIHEPMSLNPLLAWTETWGAVIADGLVALGVYGEIFFSGRARRIDGELRSRSNAELASAKKSLAEADAEIARLFDHARRASAPRSINHEVFAEAIKDLPKGRVIILYERHVPDAHFLAMGFASGFGMAGWNTEAALGADLSSISLPPILPWQVVQSPIRSPWGISLAAKEFRHDDKTDKLSVIMRAIFESGAETSVSHGSDPQLPDDTVRLIVCAKAVSWPGLATETNSTSATTAS